MSVVAGKPLKKVLNSNVLDKIVKAMMLLVQKSASGAVDQARAGSSRPNHSVSLELSDEQEESANENSGKRVNEEDCGELGLQNRPRGSGGQSEILSVRRGVEGSSGGINRTLTVVGNRGIMTPTHNPRSSKDVLGVEIRPSERWIGNHCAFKGFSAV